MFSTNATAILFCFVFFLHSLTHYNIPLSHPLYLWQYIMFIERCAHTQSVTCVVWFTAIRFTTIHYHS